MGATLDALIALRDIELQIADIRRQLAEKRQTVTRQAARLRAAEEALAQGQAQLKRAQMEADAADLDLKARDAAVTRLRDMLNTVRTNKEYAAVLSQLNNEKAERNRVENRALELLNEVENRRKFLAEQEQVVREESRRLTDLNAQLTQVQESFAGRLAALQQEREKAASRLEPKTIELFNRISERYDGETMARVVQVHPRRAEFICDGCHMSLAAERYNALKTRDEVITCDSCGRILYLEEPK
jgi:predicted  nucleic acid-binding Zn-ribbon protein